MGLWYKTGDVTALRELSPSAVVCLDVETTGLNPRVDEVLQIALVRGDGEVLTSRYVRPEHHLAWPSAQRLHGITPSMVEECSPLASSKLKIGEAFEAADLIVGYNVTFDLSFLRMAGISVGTAPIFDVMREFAPVAGHWSANRQRFAWVPLTCCAQFYGIPLRAHDALEDARATLGCFWAMLERGVEDRPPVSSRSYLGVVAVHSRAETCGERRVR